VISKQYLHNAYVRDKKSTKQISNVLGCSENKVTYWLQKYDIKKRSISDAVYIKSNPKGNPFQFRQPRSDYEWFLYGLGLGLFWGEGNKANKHAVRLGNSDPELIKKFIEFLCIIYQIDQSKLRFGLQIFSDTSPKQALTFWCKHLNLSEDKFYKVIVTKSGKIGNYRKKNVHGVLTVYFSNIKLRDIIVSAIKDCKKVPKPS
jgi:hypothetical protein